MRLSRLRSFIRVSRNYNAVFGFRNKDIEEQGLRKKGQKTVAQAFQPGRIKEAGEDARPAEKIPLMNLVSGVFG